MIKQPKAILDRVNSEWLGVPAKISPVSLTLPDDLTYDDWAEIRLRIARVKRFATWALSDWPNYGAENMAKPTCRRRTQPDSNPII